MTELMEQVRAAKQRHAQPGEASKPAGDSPARSPNGNIRNLQRMGDAKFYALHAEMQDYATDDPPAYKAVTEEAERRASG